MVPPVPYTLYVSILSFLLYVRALDVLWLVTYKNFVADFWTFTRLNAQGSTLVDKKFQHLPTCLQYTHKNL